MTPFEFGQFVKQAIESPPAPAPAGQNRSRELIANLRQQGITRGSWTVLPDGSSVPRSVTYGPPKTAPAVKPSAPVTGAKPPVAPVKPSPAVPASPNAPSVQTRRSRSAF